MQAVEHVILCGGARPGRRVPRDNVLHLKLGDGDGDIRLKITDITTRLASALPPILTDLVELASYVYCADQAVTRGGEGIVDFGRGWRRRFSFMLL
jgi:hypothetical protein